MAAAVFALAGTFLGILGTLSVEFFRRRTETRAHASRRCNLPALTSPRASHAC